MVRDLHETFPDYGFSRHKGYSTPSHMAALANHGPCPEHRMSFANVIGVVRARTGLPDGAGPELAGGDFPGLAGEQAPGLAGDEAEELAGNEAELSYG